MNIARIKDGVVVNLEVADAEWVNANNGINDYVFVEYSDSDPAHIGLGWSSEEGFEQPPVPVITDAVES
jgi:hypothetical protein